MRNVTTVLFIFLFVLIGSAVAVERTVEISDREIVERLTRLEEGQKGLNERIDDLNDNLSKRIDDVNDNLSKRIDDLNDNLSKRIDAIQGLMWVLLAGMFALIGFVIWDRRTAIAPVVRENRELAEREKRLENVIKEYARKEPGLLEILKSVGIL